MRGDKDRIFKFSEGAENETMNEQEIQILSYIKEHGSFEKPVPLNS